MFKYSLRVKLSEVGFIPVELFTNRYPKPDVKRELVRNNLINLSSVASPEQLEKFCKDFGISEQNYANVSAFSADTIYSDVLTLLEEDNIKRVKIGQILKSDVAEKYFGVTDKYVKLNPTREFSPEQQEAIGFASSGRKFKFLVPYTGSNEELRKLFDSVRGKLPGLTSLQWYELLQKPRLLKKWVESGNSPETFQNPKPNKYFSNAIFKQESLDRKLVNLGYSDEDINKLSIQEKINILQPQINQQLEEYFLLGALLSSSRYEKIKYVGEDPSSLPEDVRLFGATESQWVEMIDRKYSSTSSLAKKLRSDIFANLPIEKKSEVISKIWDTGVLPRKTKQKFAYTGNDPKTIEKLKEYNLYGRPIDSDDIRATDYMTSDNFRQRLSRNKWTKKLQEYEDAILSNLPNVDELREQLQKIWNEVLTYSSSKSQMDKILDDSLKPLNKVLSDQGIQLLDEQVVYAQYKAGTVIRDALLRFDYLIRKDGRIVLAIENQGDQHYVPSLIYKFADQDVALQKWLSEKLRDKLKLDFCHDHNIPLLYISGYLTTAEYRTIAENLARDINYYTSLVPSGENVEIPGNNNQNRYIASETGDLELELKKYADRLVSSHFSELERSIYSGIEEYRIMAMIHDKKILLSNLLAVYASNFGVDGFNNLEYIKSLKSDTDLSYFYRFIDEACVRFGYSDSQLGKIHDKVSLSEKIEKKKYKLPNFSSVSKPNLQELYSSPVQEMSFGGGKKKRYRIRRLL